jgi:hypothetical protein
MNKWALTLLAQSRDPDYRQFKFYVYTGDGESGELLRLD